MTTNILERILARRRASVAAEEALVSLDVRRRRADQRRDHRDFAAALASDREVRIIAEFKRASPSKGLLAEYLDPAGQARAYAAGGAAALSVLTEPDFFKGSLEDLRAARAAVDLPVLRKDFVFCPYQVYASAAEGADAVLLIARMLDDDTLSALLDCARDAGLSALVEVHDETDARRAVAVDAQLVAINNRDLESFHTDKAVAGRLAASLGTGRTIVAASGIFSPEDIRANLDKGICCFLVGEALVRAPDPATLLNSLNNASRLPGTT